MKTKVISQYGWEESMFAFLYFENIDLAEVSMSNFDKPKFIANQNNSKNEPV